MPYADVERVVPSSGFASLVRALQRSVTEIQEEIVMTDDPKGKFISFVTNRDAKALKVLLQAHPELREQINATWFPFGKTALIEARSDLETVKILLDAGADPTVRSDWEFGSYGVLNENSAEMVKFFLQKGVPLDPHTASEQGWLEELKELRETQPDLANKRGPDGQFPLHYAAGAEVAEYLLSIGADINGRCLDHDSTAVQYAVAQRPEVAAYLIEQGAEFDLPVAVVLGEFELVKKAYEKDPSAISLRAGKGKGDINRWHLHNFSPAMLAVGRNHWPIFDWLVERMKPEEEFFERCWAGQTGRCLKLLEEHPKLNQAILKRAKLLPDAAWHGRLEAVRTMLDLGFPINTPGDHESTAVDRASIRGWADIVKTCISRGASLECRNEFGSTPLSAACWGSLFWREPEGDYPAVVEMLLEAGCNGAAEPMESDPRGLRKLIPWIVENQVDPAVLRKFGESRVVPTSAQHLFMPPL